MTERIFTIEESQRDAFLLPRYLVRRTILRARWSGEVNAIWKDDLREKFSSDYLGDLDLRQLPEALLCEASLRPMFDYQARQRPWPERVGLAQQQGAFEHVHSRAWFARLNAYLTAYARARGPPRLYQRDFSNKAWEFVPPTHADDWTVRRRQALSIPLRPQKLAELVQAIGVESFLYRSATLTLDYRR